MVIVLVAIGILVAPLVGQCAPPQCQACRQTIQGRHWKIAQVILCERCYATRLPLCATCKGKTTGGFIRTEDGKFYCSKACRIVAEPPCEICRGHFAKLTVVQGSHYYCETHVALPRCGSCGLPQQGGRPLDDGRVICRACWPHVVTESRHALELYKFAIAEVEAVTGYRSPTEPPMHLLNRDELQEKRGESEVTQAGCEVYLRGFYRRQGTLRERNGGRGRRFNRAVKEDIYLLSAMRTNEFLMTAAHELTHDMLYETVAQLDVAPEWLTEGACQYVGAMVATRLNATNELHTALHREDAVYGGGYRFFKGRFGDHDWKGLLQWLNRNDLGSLPKEAPATGSLQVGN